jgi:RNA polymerase sigma-70 factor (ECF subfamily)
MLKQINNDYATLSDSELASRIAAKDVVAVRLVTARNNQRLFRTAWSILKDRSEAEDAVQDGYLKAFRRHRRLCREVIAFNMANPNCRQ